jgi:hypothetical protein
MAERNDFEEFIATTFRYPLFGIICSAVLACLGYYLTTAGPQVSPADAWVSFLPTAETLGQFCFIVAGVVMAISVGGYLWRATRK